MRVLKVLIACEYSGRTREAFRKLGHDAWSCDLLPPEDGSPYHLQCDVLTVLDRGWDLMIAHPDCTYLTCSAEWCYKDNPGKHMSPGVLFGAARRAAREEALIFFGKLLDAPVPCIAAENPVGVVSSRIRKPDQIIQPHQFGEDASKTTCLWLKGLPPLKHTQHVAPRVCGGQKRWANQTDSGQNRLGPSPDRWKERARTYQGWSDAMAEQWSAYLLGDDLI